MKTKKYLLLILVSFLLLTTNGCAGTGAGMGGGLGSISKTNRLIPGMNPYQVKAVLGEPLQTQFVANKWIWKYSLHEYWKGWVPYYLAFGKESKILEEWYADEQEYMQQQQLWMQSFDWLQAFPPVQKIEGAGALNNFIESRIDGDFEGWDGDTIFKLTNGQIWQQASYSYTYHYAFKPKVLIYRTNPTSAVSPINLCF